MFPALLLKVSFCMKLKYGPYQTDLIFLKRSDHAMISGIRRLRIDQLNPPKDLRGKFHIQLIEIS